MQASLIHPQEYYAWHRNPPKGAIPLGALKVRVRDVIKTKGMFETNARTMVNIIVVDTGQEKQVRAREIIDFWDSYEREAAYLIREQSERERKHRRERKRPQILRARIEHELAEKGLLTTGQTTIYGSNIQLPLPAIMEWLGINWDEIEVALDKLMEDAEEQS